MMWNRDPFYTYRGDINADYYVRVFASEPTIWICTGWPDNGDEVDLEYSYVVLPRPSTSIERVKAYRARMARAKI